MVMNQEHVEQLVIMYFIMIVYIDGLNGRNLVLFVLQDLNLYRRKSTDVQLD